MEQGLSPKQVDPPFDEHQCVRFKNIKVNPLMCSKVHGTVPNVKNMHIASLNFTSITKLDALSSQHYVNNIHIVLGSAVVWKRNFFKAERPSVVLLISVCRIRWICEYNSHIHLRR